MNQADVGQPDPYVRLYIQNGVEIATCLASDFRAAMAERDAEIERLRADLDHETSFRVAAYAENERLRETIGEWQEIHGTLTGDVHRACQQEIERLRAENERLQVERDAGLKVIALAREYAKSGLDAVLSAELAEYDDIVQSVNRPRAWQS